MPRAQVERPYQILTLAETADLLDAAEADGARSFALVALMLGAGLRVSETVALEVRSLVETDRGELLVHVEGKGGRSRTVPLGDDVAEALRGYLHASGRNLGDPGRLFLAEDRAARSRTGPPGLSPNAVFLGLRRLVERARIRAKTVSPHSLRHTFAVRYLRTGPGEVAALQKILGHASLTTTQCSARTAGSRRLPAREASVRVRARQSSGSPAGRLPLFALSPPPHRRLPLGVGDRGRHRLLRVGRFEHRDDGVGVKVLRRPLKLGKSLLLSRMGHLDLVAPQVPRPDLEEPEGGLDGELGQLDGGPLAGPSGGVSGQP